MKTFLISFISALVTMLTIDAVWLTRMTGFYRTHIGHLMAETPRFLPAGIFYILYITGLWFLVLSPALSSDTTTYKIFLYGVVFGAVAYGTYDLTNHATLKEWPAIVTGVDIVWGALLTGTVAVVATAVTRYFI